MSFKQDQIDGDTALAMIGLGVMVIAFGGIAAIGFILL